MMRAKAAQKQFLEKDRAVALAASIVTAQEQKLQQKLEKGHAQAKQAGHDRSSRRQSSRAKLKETMAKLAAQKVKKTKKRRQETKAGEGSGGGRKSTSTGKRVAFNFTCSCHAMPRTPEEYAAYLSKKRDALAHFNQTTEIPQSIGLPNATADAHRKLVIAAFLNANGDPADGRWTQLAHLCRLDSTRGGYRWLGTRVERRTHGGRGRSITRVDSKCLNIEKRQTEESCLVQKVESWKQTMTREMANNVEGSNFHKSPARQASLGFKVTKHSALTNVPKSSSGRHRTDLQTSSPELSFLPPSFPSHLAASTPQPGRRKPPPIPHVSFSSPLILSGNVQVRDETNTPATKAGVRRSFSGHNLVPSTAARPPGTKTPHNVPPPSYMDNVENRVFGSFGDGRVSEVEDLNVEPRSQVHFLTLLDANGDDFNPLFTSTQKGVGVEGISLSRTGYDTHFDVNGRVEEVAQLLEEDIGLYR